MAEVTDVQPADWLTPMQAVALLASRLSRPDDARAIELILDHAAEGRIFSKAASISVAEGAALAVEREQRVSASLWDAIRIGAIYSCWDTGDFDFQTHMIDHGWVTATIRGTRLLRSDVEAIVPLPFSVEPASIAPPMAAAPWSEARMIEAIAACPIANREDAWRQHFKPLLPQHGWNNEAFRHLWAEARGSKGRTGRPPRQ